MKQRCIDAVQKAAGRQLNQAEIKGIEDRISKNMRQLARQDPQAWRQLSESQRYDAAGQAAIKELIAEANKAKQRVQLAIAAKNRLDSQTGNWQGGRLDALKRLIVSDTDGRGSFQSIETRSQAIRADALRQLQEVFDALDPRMLGLLENKEATVAFVRALYGQTAGIDPKIVKAAQGWLEVADGMRETFNSAGGNVGKLEDWRLPQTHSHLRVATAGKNDKPALAQRQWVGDTMPLLDRAKYVNDDGSLFSDDQMRAFLENSWETIATGGLNKPRASQPGGAMMANRNAAGREIHFKGPEEWLKYHELYSGDPMLQTMVGHIHSMATDTASVEIFGPNPNHMFELLANQGESEAALADPKRKDYYKEQKNKLVRMWNYTTGQPTPIASERLARFFDGLRNWLVSTRLGSAVVTSVADEGTMLMTARINNMSYMQVFGNELRAMNLANGEELRQARRAGLAMDTMIGDLNRMGQDNLGSTITSKMAHATMKASGLNALTDARRRAFGVTMMDSIGHLTREVKSLADLSPSDNRILLSKGITDTDWAVWREADPEKWGGNDTVLTPDAIYDIPTQKLQHLVTNMGFSGPDLVREVQKIKRDAALRLIGAVAEEVDMAVITPKNIERMMGGAGVTRGTWSGELWRSVMLFKSTPLAAVYRHWKRGLSMPTGTGKAKYIAMHIATTTLLGAFAMQLKELVAGRDPRNLNPMADNGVKNWTAAFLQGGGVGIYGDFLLSGTTRHETSPTAGLLGPAVGLMEATFNLTQGNLVQLAQGKKTDFGAELVRFGKSNMPVVNLWYTKAALDHLIFNDLQEYASPGYLSKSKRRMQKEFGASYYWDPKTDHIRAPDLGRTWQK